jgi:integral membrane protein
VDIVRTLRLVSLAEATSFLLLLIATAVKYGAESPQGVQILGPVHGTLFIAYCALVIVARGRTGWDGRRTLLALVAGVLPFAPFYVERAWLRPVVPEQG